jgi:hypothetical protein
MLRPPYNRKELEHTLAVELQAVRALLAPALSDLRQCQVDLRARGFLADEPYRSLFDSSEKRFRSDCLEQCEGGDPDQISLEDLVELYPDRMLQPMHNYPTARSRYRACIGDALWKKAKDELDVALKARWTAFAAEANCYSDIPLKGAARGPLIEGMLIESLGEAGFHTFTVSKTSVAKWHPRPSWVDAVAGAMTHDDLDIIMLVETSRPLKYITIQNYLSEPDERGTGFDKISVSSWALPRRRIPELGAIALKIRNSLLLYYSDFYSPKGLRRIIDAHVAQARVTTTRFD